MEAFPGRGKRRPAWTLLRWVNTLVARRRETHDLHLVFSDGLTLCTVLERLRPGTSLVKFRRAVTRGTALSNLEQALALVWQHQPQSSAMPSAAQVLDGNPRELLLRFISELYTIYVVRPTRGRLCASLDWMHEKLMCYGMALAPSTLQPPHATLRAELRSGTALAIALHSCLLPARTPKLEGGVYWAPRSEDERARSVRVVFDILERERLACCSADELCARCL